jgi:hypothetical protein
MAVLARASTQAHEAVFDHQVLIWWRHQYPTCDERIAGYRVPRG